jgi:hypothetical protein
MGTRTGRRWPPIVGFDVAVTDDHGRISTVLGFLDTVPAI